MRRATQSHGPSPDDPRLAHRGLPKPRGEVGDRAGADIRDDPPDASWPGVANGRVDRGYSRARLSIAIVTGPNSGGKTTYTRAIGQAQVLAQAGLLVPGSSARISPVDAIYSHFAAPERTDIGGGRLTEELERLAQIFRQATRHSLILLNEPLASTDHAAARALCRDVLAGLQLLGARAVFVTHIYELADDADLPGVVSLTAGVATIEQNGDAPVPSYSIAPGRPQVAGYAAELARRHGLSRDQIASTLRERGV